MPTGELTRAKIINKDDESKVVTCMFNPKEYSFSKSNTWTIERVEGSNIGHAKFGGGEPAVLSLNLLFDTYEAHPHTGHEAGSDVRDLTKVLWDLMKVDTTKIPAEPPHCYFEWGGVKFEAVITSLTQRFTLFLNDGTPVRAEVSVSFKQMTDEGQYPRQNPTSGGKRGEHVRIVHEGETLAFIAYQEYGDSNQWRHLAHANRIDDPRRLRPGETLIITPLPY
jgi:hypothetical protein